MIMENKIKYLVENKLIVYPTRGTLQENYFSIEYLLTPMQINSPGAIHDEWISYNIKLIDIFNSLDCSLEKSTDFLRRCSCRYDGLQVSINADIGDIKIDNKTAQQTQWTTISSLLQADYKGFFVDEFLTKINNIMNEAEIYHIPTSNYFYLGLLFLGIPNKTSVGWSRRRRMMLSDFDDVVFVEKLNHEQDMDDKRCFAIVGENINESTNCRINKYYGRAQVPMNSFFPDWTQLEIDYTKEDINVYWKYELTKQVEQ